MLREDEPTTGTETIETMKLILQPNKHCIALAEEVAAFYGTDFDFEVNPGDTLSRFVAYGGIQERVCIKLKPNTGREREALTHELLHAKLLMKGFPWPDIDGSRPGEGRAINLLNHIHHYLMFHDYQSMGLDIGKFYTNSGNLTDEQFDQEIINTELIEGNWCFRWTCNWIDEQILGSDLYQGWRERQWPRVLEKFPNLQQTTPRIQEWFERGDYAVPERFITSYTELVDIMQRQQLPGYWYHLERGNGKPKFIWKQPH